MDLFTAIRVQALRDTLNPDQDALLRRIHRWYSKEFSTPLHEALELPLEDVIQAYFEEKYEAMEDAELELERQDLLEDPDKKKEKEKHVDAAAADDEEFARRVEAEERAKASQEKKVVPVKPPEATLPVDALKKIPPDLKMVFVDPEEFEQELEGFGNMSPPKKPQSF